MRLQFIVVCLLWVLGPVAGCYDGELLLSEARSTVITTRVAEVDLGRYFTTLPRNKNDNSFTEIEVHLFATILRSRVATVEKHLAAEEYRLRHDLLATVRGATAEELTEPSLARLRDRIEGVVNFILGEPVKSVGFYALTMRQR